MAENVGGIFWNVDADTTGAVKSISDVERQTQRTEKSFLGLDRSAKKLSSGLSKVFAGVSVGILAGQLVNVQRQFDKLNAALITSTGSMENASTAFGALEKFAAETPYALEQSITAFTKLVNYGLTPSEKALRSYGDTASAMGKDLEQMIEAVADAATGEFERLKEFGIKARNQGDTIAFTFRGTTQVVKNNAAEIESYLIALGENNFAGSMANRMATLDGAFSNLGDTINSTFLTIMQSGVGEAIESAVRAAIDALSALNRSLASGQTVAALAAIGSKFDGFGRDIAMMMNDITELWSQIPTIWGTIAQQAGTNIIGAFTNLPENLRAIVQLMTVELAFLADAGKATGSNMVTDLTLSFAKMVEVAKVYSRKIDSVLKPWEFDSVDLDAELAKVSSAHEKASAKIKSGNEAALAAAKQAREATIMSIMSERQASIDSFDAQIDGANNLLKKYDEMKAARDNGGDVLAGFKVGGDGGSNATGGTGNATAEKYANLAERLSVQAIKLQSESLALEKALTLEKAAREGVSEAIRKQISDSYDLRIANAKEAEAARAAAKAQQEADKKDAKESRELAEKNRAKDLAQGIVNRGTTNSPELLKLQNERSQLETVRDQMLDEAELFQAALNQIEEDGAKARMDIAAMSMGSFSSTFDELANVLKKSEGEQSSAFKAMFALSKGFAIAQAGLNLSKAVMDAFSWGGLTPVEKFASAAAVAAAGAGFVSAIAGASYSGREHGGSVMANQVYEVGEKNKPEMLMIPGNNGKVFSNSEVKSMMGGGSGGGAPIINNYAASAGYEVQYRRDEVTKRDVFDIVQGEMTNPNSKGRRGMQQNSNLHGVLNGGRRR